MLHSSVVIFNYKRLARVDQQLETHVSILAGFVDVSGDVEAVAEEESVVVDQIMGDLETFIEDGPHFLLVCAVIHHENLLSESTLGSLTPDWVCGK